MKITLWWWRRWYFRSIFHVAKPAKAWGLLWRLRWAGRVPGRQLPLFKPTMMREFLIVHGGITWYNVIIYIYTYNPIRYYPIFNMPFYGPDADFVPYIPHGGTRPGSLSVWPSVRISEWQCSCNILGLKIGYPWLPHFRTQPLVLSSLAQGCRWIRFEDEVCNKNPEHLGVHLSHSKSALISVFLAG